MHYQKTGMPEENDLLLCTVTNVQYNSVFCSLDEYDKKSGMIHISEVSPGRIRNIRDYVTVGKKVVCKVLRIDQEKGHIDLSLRRVNENQRREKNMEVKQEMKAEKLIDFYAKQEKLEPDKVYQEIAPTILEAYEYLYTAFDELVAGEVTLEELGVSATHAKKLSEIIKEKIPPKSVTLKGTFALTTYDEKGVAVIKEALLAARKTDEKRVDIRYLGNGKYRMQVEHDDYEHAEALLAKATKATQAVMDTYSPSVFAFERDDK